jgi:hypothetical protein
MGRIRGDGRAERARRDMGEQQAHGGATHSAVTDCRNSVVAISASQSGSFLAFPILEREDEEEEAQVTRRQSRR